MTGMTGGAKYRGTPIEPYILPIIPAVLAWAIGTS